MSTGSPHIGAQLLSGIVFTQDQTPQTETDYIDLENDTWAYQEFYFPEDYRRGSEEGEYITPEFSGFQILTDIEPGTADVVGLDWQIQRYLFGTGWITEGEGTTLQSYADGDEVWLHVIFDQLISPTEDSLQDKWRFGVRGREPVVDGAFNQVVPYDGNVATIDTLSEYVKLTPGTPYSFLVDGVPSVLIQDPSTEEVFYSVQQGLKRVWVSRPNPLVNYGFVRATEEDDDPIQIEGEDVSLIFRLFAMTADSGIDFLGNTYRSALHKNETSGLDTIFGDETDTYWLSKPNPSRFAIESLYFDVRDLDGNPSVIDEVLVDPVTPNVYFNIYYSDTDNDDIDDTDAGWEERIWKHVPKTFKMTQRQSHVLPVPVVAKYIQIEFCHLQPKAYNPGDFQQPIRYKKHPKWVLDYFLIRTELDQLTTDGNQFVPRQVGITYNALDLAYNYYLDDIAQEPNGPIAIDPNIRQQYASQLTQVTDTINLADTETLAKVSLALRPFQDHPALKTIDYLLSEATLASLDNYPVELSDLPLPDYDTSALRSNQKDRVIYEAAYPVMFFFVPSRHRYKELQAKLTYNRAYFVGVRQIAFSRERYTVKNDTPLYVETMGDSVNMERNDFIRVEEGLYSVY